MNDTNKVALATAVAAGYALGRTRKAKLALTVGTYLAGRRFKLSPQELVTEESTGSVRPRSSTRSATRSAATC